MNSSIVPVFGTNKIRTGHRYFPKRTHQLVAENFQLLRSNIHGIGLFSLSDYLCGTEMNAAFSIDQLSYLDGDDLDDKDADSGAEVTQLCAIRYMNHSETANIGFCKLGRNLIVARCLKNIHFGDEITTDYRTVFALLGKPVPAWVSAGSGTNPATRTEPDPEYEHALTGISVE